MFKTAVIAIGGKGTRLKEITNNIPKPLFPIDGKSSLVRICEELTRYGVKRIILTINNQINLFTEELQKIKLELSIIIETFVEEEPLGECGALWEIKDSLENEFLFINGDIVFSLDLIRLYKFHYETSSLLTIVTHTSTHPNDSDILSTPNGTLVESIFPKNENRDQNIPGFLGNAGIACLNKEILNHISKPTTLDRSSLFNHVVVQALKKNIRVFSYNSSEYIKDMGTPKRFEEVSKEIKNGTLERKNYRNKQTALFLDRDNTLIKCSENQYILSKENVQILKENINKISKVAQNFQIKIIATNQPQISMGKLTFKKLAQINSHVVKKCIENDLFIDDIIFCPHHPHGGFPEELSYLKINCFCRKPNPGMFLHMSQTKNIDLSNSLFIGDSEIDKEASRRAGIPFLNIKDL